MLSCATLLLGSVALTPGLRPIPQLVAQRAAGTAPRARIVAYSVDQPIDVGERLPEVEVEVMDGFDSVGAGALGVTKRLSDVVGRGRTILLGMPGAFTPTCNDVHLPGYYRMAPEFFDAGVDTIALVTTNDRFVNAQWQKSMEECMGVPEGQSPVVMLSDARGDLAESLGLIGYLGKALGVRSKRFALVIEDGVVKYKAVDAGSDALDSTSAEEVLKYLEESEGLFDGLLPPAPVLAGGAGLIFILWFFDNFV